MNLWQKPLFEFVDLVDSNSPAPGGGSCAALMSTLGLALARMVGHLSVNKKLFLKHDEKVQKEFNETLITLLELKEKIIPLIDEDTASFNAIMAAFRLANKTQEEKLLRSQEIKNATLQAIKIPYQVAKLSLEALLALTPILTYGNKQTMSDLGVGILALCSGIEGAVYNVLINLIGFREAETVTQYQKEVKQMLEVTKQTKTKLLGQIYRNLEFA